MRYIAAFDRIELVFVNVDCTFPVVGDADVIRDQVVYCDVASVPVVSVVVVAVVQSGCVVVFVPADSAVFD